MADYLPVPEDEAYAAARRKALARRAAPFSKQGMHLLVLEKASEREARLAEREAAMQERAEAAMAAREKAAAEAERRRDETAQRQLRVEERAQRAEDRARRAEARAGRGEERTIDRLRPAWGKKPSTPAAGKPSVDDLLRKYGATK